MSSEACGTIDFDIDASGSLEILAIQADTGAGGGALLFLTSGGPMTLGGTPGDPPDFAIDMNASGLFGEAGELVMHAGGPLTIREDIRADGSFLDGFAGSVEMEGCTLTVLPGVTIRANGAQGAIVLRDGAQMDVRDAAFSADPNTGLIELDHRNAAQVPLTDGTTFTGPTPILAVDPTVQNCDLDGDGFLNAEDNCPHTSNPAQEDNGGLGFLALPGELGDGIGDACQCGDLDNDGAVTGIDLADGRAGLANPAQFIAAPEKCNVIGATDATLHPELPIALDCRIDDITVLKRALTDPSLTPGILQKCAPAVP
jgi:hypothetical protein